MSRREWLMAMGMAPVAGAATSTRRWAEIDKILASGDVRGRIARADLPTPALLLDLDAFEANVAAMTAFAKQKKLALRPHGKTHKCPEIANALIRAGARGACAAKLSEAEVFAAHGVRGLLITTAVVGTHKIERAIALARRAPDTIFCVDNAQNTTDLNDASRAAGVTMNTAIDLYVGGRTGIPCGEPAAALARQIASLKNLRFTGLQAYAGQASHVIGFAERKRASEAAMAPAVATRRAIERDGIACPLLSGGSTGTYNIDASVDGITELQPGSFVFMDVDYNRIGGDGSPVYRDFKNALTVLTTVVSKPTDRQAVVDGGLKAFSTDKPFPPEARGVAGISFAWGGDEHGRLTLTDAAASIRTGDRIEFVIPHCDPTVNLYDRMFCLRGDTVESVWKIAARGMSQ